MIVLASRSPRRRELLDQIGVSCRLAAVDVDESPTTGETPRDYVERLARAKAAAGLAAAGDALPVLGADTAVARGGELLGKPVDRADAMRMLALLSGQVHEVCSGVAVAVDGRVDSRVACSRVAFRDITPAEAAAYWDTGEPEGKAGAYAIQGLAAIFVRWLEGSYSSVVGLPLFETADLLARAGVHPLPPATGLESGGTRGE